MNQDRFTESAPDYALGLLEGDAFDAFERHLAEGCAACERELAAMDAVGDALAYAAPVFPPPAALRERVLAAVAEDQARRRAGIAAPGAPEPASPPPVAVPAVKPPDRGQATPPWWMRLAPPLALAGLVAAALAGAWGMRLDGRLTLVRADLERVQAENQALARILAVAQSDSLLVVPLSGLADAPAARGHVLWAPGTRQAVLYAFDLPRPPAGRDYQLWVIVGETPRSAGVFPVGADGRALHILSEAPAAGGASGFAVTLEPAGGMPQPTGAMLLLGAVAVDG